MKKISLLFFVGVMLSYTTAYAQATGFIPSAGVNLNTALTESSGLEYCRGKLWSHNDSGGQPQIYSIDPATGAILQTITLKGITNVDWEDLTADGYYLYIGDVGNNANAYKTAISTGTAGNGIQGNIRYNSDKNHIEGFNGLYWIPLDVKQ
jgi:hypothetical protein